MSGKGVSHRTMKHWIPRKRPSEPKAVSFVRGNDAVPFRQAEPRDSAIPLIIMCAF